MGKSILRDKAYQFSISVINLCRNLQLEQKEYILSRQLLRSGTAVGALVREAEFGESRADFAHKMNVALKEANETEYWLHLLRDTQYISTEQFISIWPRCDELIRLLVSTVRTLKSTTK